MNYTEELNKLKTLDEGKILSEDLHQSTVPLFTYDISGNTLSGYIRPTVYFDLEIPEGVEIMDASLDWKLYSTISGYSFSTVNKVVFPSSLIKINRILFGTYPQYNLTIVFKGDVLPILESWFEQRPEKLDKVLKAKGRKQEFIERILCVMLGTYYTKTKFVFEVPIDYSKLSYNKLNITNFEEE